MLMPLKPSKIPPSSRPSVSPAREACGADALMAHPDGLPLADAFLALTHEQRSAIRTCLTYPEHRRLDEALALADERHRHTVAWAALDPNVPAWVTDALLAAGLQAREVRVDPKAITPAIRRALPKEAASALAKGRVPEAGFGLLGGPGVGKTATLAALMRVWAEAWVRSVGPSKAAAIRHTSLGLAWVNWPEFVAAGKGAMARERGEEAETAVLEAMDAGVLVLDDLGRERVRGSYVEDWGASQLDRLVDHRDRRGLVTFWTSNLGTTDLAHHLGAGLTSRLCRLAPPVVLPANLPDRRAAGLAS